MTLALQGMVINSFIIFLHSFWLSIPHNAFVRKEWEIGLDKYISLCYDEKATLFDYLDNPVIFLDDWSAVKESYTNFVWQHHQDIEALLSEHIISKGMEDYYAPDSYLVKQCEKCPTVVAEDFVRTTLPSSLWTMNL